MEEEDAEADTARDEEVKGGDGESAIDVALDANATDNLVLNDNDPYFEIDDESLGGAQDSSCSINTIADPY